MAGVTTAHALWAIIADGAADNTTTVNILELNAGGTAHTCINETTYEETGVRKTVTYRPGRDPLVSYTSQITPANSEGIPAGASLIIDGAAGTRTARYQTTVQPLQKIETTTAGGLIISRSTYTYTDMEPGDGWRFDRDYTVRIDHSDGTFEQSTYTAGHITAGIRRDGSVFSRFYDYLGRMEKETTTTSGGRQSNGDSRAPILIRHRNLYDFLGHTITRQRETPYNSDTWTDVESNTTLSTGETIHTIDPQTGLGSTSWTWRD